MESVPATTLVVSIATVIFLVSGCSKPTPVQSLIDAAGRGNVAGCERLIKSGVPVNGTDGNGDTALDWAIYYHHLDVIRKLIELGADVNHTDHAPGYTRGFTPLMYVATPFRGKGYYPETMAVRNQIAQLLIQNGADVNRSTKAAGAFGGGDTALHFAVEDQNPQLIRMLLAAGASKNVKDEEGYTPMDIAKWSNYAPNTAVINALEGK
ncbi:MAG TPA: ankyrin repeat domain-containing protein [Tepidisphaeraceae bacterium]|nr:ankyrin repeat domain-containing protein [Tepidisphaeraceae bacterium]